MGTSVLILGASGRFGHNAAQAFRAAGWTVRTFDRKTDDLAQAARGMDVIVSGWNPAYPDWATQVPVLHQQVIAAAKAADATVILPGNVYVYGPDQGPVWTAATPHRATNPLGRIRRDMERAYRDSGVRVILLRAGDFIDTGPTGNWFDMIMTKKIAKGLFTYPGRADIPHAWAYLPDLARAAVMLAEKRADLAPFQEVLFPGYTLTGTRLAAALARVCGRPVRLKQMAWWPFRVMAPVWKMAACLTEMRYLWDLPHQLDGQGFGDLLPAFTPTGIDVALRSALPEGALHGEIHPDNPVTAGAHDVLR